MKIGLKNMICESEKWNFSLEIYEIGIEGNFEMLMMSTELPLISSGAVSVWDRLVPRGSHAAFLVITPKSLAEYCSLRSAIQRISCGVMA